MSSRRQSIRPSIDNSSNPLEIDTNMMETLEKAKKLNWWVEIGLGRELIPLATPIVSISKMIEEKNLKVFIKGWKLFDACGVTRRFWSSRFNI